MLGLHCCQGFSLVVVQGFSLRWLLLLQSTGSVVVAHGFSCPTACGIFPDQGLNLCLLHWQVDPSPLSHQGSPRSLILSWDLELKGLRHLLVYLPSLQPVGLCLGQSEFMLLLKCAEGTSITSLRNAFSVLRNSAWVVRKSHIVPLKLLPFFGTCSVDRLLLHP